jgi:hypothetical protein
VDESIKPVIRDFKLPAKTKFCANYNGHDEHFWHEPQADNSVKKWHCRGN